jgi:TolB-like protein/Tfp pilus assembly protein PilF
MYEVLAPLGVGGMGEVYRAKDLKLGREVALKLLPEEFARDQERLERLLREAQTLASLNHPNIATIYRLDDEGGGPRLVLELVAGETLAQRLERGAVPVAEALALAIQIASAVEAAHERGIVHRDLKPGNVMITPTGTAKVLDFGLATTDPRFVAKLGTSQSDTHPTPAGVTRAGALLGTAAYMSPEQVRGKPVDRRADIWAFATVLFETLAGRPAFAGDTLSDVIVAVLEREPDWPALPVGTPSHVKDVLKRSLRKDAGARPADIRDVRLELEAVVERGITAAASERSIAVLPFENLSGPDDDYFADGITDEIMNALLQLPGLRVAARSSCFAFKGRRDDLRAIGDKLRVSTVLEGTVRRSGQRLRITVRLADAADGYQLWSENYDREMTDVFELQDEIAGAIASRLRGALHNEADRLRARHGTRNLEAYELLLRGRALQVKRGRFLPEAIGCFETAIALDPNYSEALAWLSDSYRLLNTFGDALPSMAMPKARSLAERSLAIQPDQAEAWTTLACVEEQYEWNFQRAGELWSRALTIDPRHARGRSQRALWGVARGAMGADEARAEMRQALQDDPLNSWVVAMYSHVLGFLGDYEESLRQAERAFALDRESFFSHWNVMRAHAYAGQYERAIVMAPALCLASGRNQWVLGTLAWTYGKTGSVPKARAVFDELEGRSRHEYASTFWLTIAADAGGLPDEARALALRACDERDPLVVWGRVAPLWDGIRTRDYFRDIERSIWGDGG